MRKAAPSERGTELSTRSDGRELPAWDTALKLHPLLDADAELATWRIAEGRPVAVFSRSDLPFEVHLAWSAGGGAGAEAKVTVARRKAAPSSRICVFARGLRIRAGNLSDAPNRVGVTVADAYAVTENQWEATGDTGDLQGTADIAVPPFARRVRVELADEGLLPTTLLRVFDGQSVLRSTVTGERLPPDGVPLGGARLLTVTPGGTTTWRAVFTLSL